MAKTYDPACYELAEHFLRDEPISDTPYEQACRDLALHIQQAVEDWFIVPDAAALGPRDKDKNARIEALEAALREAEARSYRLRLELEKIGWMDEFLDADGARAMMDIARAAVNDDAGTTWK